MHSLTSQILRELRRPAWFEVEERFLQFLQSDEISALTQEEVFMPSNRDYVLAWAMHKEIMNAGRNIKPGWAMLRCIDEHTWFAIRDCRGGNGEQTSPAFRYEAYTDGIYELDYSTQY